MIKALPPLKKKKKKKKKSGLSLLWNNTAILQRETKYELKRFFIFVNISSQLHYYLSQRWIKCLNKVHFGIDTRLMCTLQGFGMYFPYDFRLFNNVQLLVTSFPTRFRYNHRIRLSGQNTLWNPLSSYKMGCQLGQRLQIYGVQWILWPVFAYFLREFWSNRVKSFYNLTRNNFYLKLFSQKCILSEIFAKKLILEFILGGSIKPP